MLIEPIPKAFDLLRLSLPSVIFTGHGEQLGLDSLLFKFAHDSLGLLNGHQLSASPWMSKAGGIPLVHMRNRGNLLEQSFNLSLILTLYDQLLLLVEFSKI